MKLSFIYLAVLCLLSTTVSPAVSIPFAPSDPLRQAVLANAQKQLLEAKKLDIFADALMTVAGCFPFETQVMLTEKDFCITVGFLNTFLETASNRLYKSDETVTAAFCANKDYTAPYLYLLWMRNTIISQELLRYPLKGDTSKNVERKELLHSCVTFFTAPEATRAHSLSNASSTEPSPKAPPARTITVTTKALPPVTDAVVSHSPKTTRAF